MAAKTNQQKQKRTELKKISPHFTLGCYCKLGVRKAHVAYPPYCYLQPEEKLKGKKQLARWSPLLANVTRKEGGATVYIVCNLPTTDPQIAARLPDGSQESRE